MRHKRPFLIIAAVLTAVFLLVCFEISKNLSSNGVKPALVDISKFPLMALTKSVSGVCNLAAFRNRYETRIRALQAKTAFLTKELAGATEIAQENERLRAILSFKVKLVSKTIAAELIGRDPSNWDSSIIINKGRSDGVSPDMVVAKYDGLIGTVIEAGSNTARVMLIDNPNSKISAVIQRTREQGVLVGMGNGLCKIVYLSYDSDIKPGDIVVTGASAARAGNKGILIGEVKAVTKGANTLYASAIVRPASNLFKVEEVICIE